ncbi:M1 family metallopeptidase [Chitinophaga nivalis]|uniref:M1 family metallopeptidase n=1 Tax=Chitinophaga nivalis TaxID=2991709 RepID=A0ABT3INA7_9BACT|nr:M1 family metallopeptidase [Chitinophaga nivalis]MCW3464877.1 M1 family metallopeptidase [Chitinophaga nivalis]MCW3485432.1 M1 family metallopeptidase [Chitinophaga nivalis]
MMSKMLYSLAGLLGLAIVTQAQELYTPRHIKQAYVNNTRDKSGKPGKRYWQNKGRYRIEITAQPPTRRINGTATISYINNSPDTLRGLVIQLICNVHKNEAPRSGFVDKKYLTSGVTVDAFSVNGTDLQYNNNSATSTGVKLPKPLLSGDSAQLVFNWHYDMSEQSGREGMIDSTTFFLAYYYPRVAVYDDYNGWDRTEHTGRVEFYNDFNDYEVAVKVPANYVVWGTGTLQNASEVLQPAVATRLQQSYTSDEVMRIASPAETLQGLVTRQQPWNTWRFSAGNVPDVALGLSNHYVWDAASAVTDSSTGRRASVQAAYSESAPDFKHSVGFGKYALNWFSHHWPGVAYPYPVMTAFQGEADMEYPMMVNDGSVGDNLDFAQLLQDHEMVHTYFPFYMGINESRYAFMDEGWATTFEYLINIAEKGQAHADEFYRKFRVHRYIADPSTEEDQPIISLSNQVSGMGYGSNSYGKASLAYLGLKDLLGDARFKACLHTYMDTWHGKHPIPWDFFNSFNATAGQNLDWYWQNWFFTNNYIDLAIAGVQQKDNKATVKINNNGGFAIPFDVVVTYTDGTSTKTHYTPVIWKTQARQATVTVPATKPVATVKLDGNLFMDATAADNEWKKG